MSSRSCHTRSRASRKPRLSLRFCGALPLRFAARTFLALLFQLPPRITRFEPFDLCRKTFMQQRFVMRLRVAGALAPSAAKQ